MMASSWRVHRCIKFNLNNSGVGVLLSGMGAAKLIAHQTEGPKLSRFNTLSNNAATPASFRNSPHPPFPAPDPSATLTTPVTLCNPL